MKVNATAKAHFVHGNKPYSPKDPLVLGKLEATGMEKSGLIEIGGDVEDEAEAKMGDAPENKMAEAPANKSRTKKAD